MHTVFLALAALISTSTAAPATAAPAAGITLRPSYTSQYSVWTGARDFDTSTGVVSKPNGQSTDITSLVEFNFPDWAAGCTCEFHFNLRPETPFTVAGTGQFDVFSSIQPADHFDTSTWPNGNLRDQYVGRMQAIKPGEATAVYGFTDATFPFPCPDSITFGVEIVGVGDFDLIGWNVVNEGPYFLIY